MLHAGQQAWRVLITAPLILLLCVSLAAGQVSRREYARINLIAEDDVLSPGKTTWVGLAFELEPGWHIYWTNPGDAGDPPRVEWTTPPGFSVGSFEWPVPVRFTIGPVVDYGYEDHVLLAAPLEVPASYRAGTPVALTADIRYVICREVCIPAKANVTLRIGPGASRLAERRAQFADARASWPKAMPASWALAVRAADGRVALALETGQRESRAQFFPLDFDVVDNAGPQVVAAQSRGLQLTMPLADPEAPAPDRLRGVLVLGADRAYRVDAAITASR